jgi:hypothetical protein
MAAASWVRRAGERLSFLFAFFPAPGFFEVCVGDFFSIGVEGLEAGRVAAAPAAGFLAAFIAFAACAACSFCLSLTSFLGPLEATSQVAGLFSLNSSASRLGVLGPCGEAFEFRVNDEISLMSRCSMAGPITTSTTNLRSIGTYVPSFAALFPLTRGKTALHPR